MDTALTPDDLAEVERLMKIAEKMEAGEIELVRGTLRIEGKAKGRRVSFYRPRRTA